MVVCNLYPFSEVVSSDASEDVVLENIDIGGPTMIRAGAKNYKDVLVITDPADYEYIMDNWEALNNNDRKKFALKGFEHVTAYNIAISEYFGSENIYRVYNPVKKLKYGTNPQQHNAGLYVNRIQPKLPFEILNGNPGYINILDAIYSWNLVTELYVSLNMPTAASFKHNSPAGVGVAIPLSDTLKQVYFVSKRELTPVATAFVRARNVDPMSSYGDFIAISSTVDVCTAKLIATEISDGIIAQDYTPEALEILKKKKMGNYVILQGNVNMNTNTNNVPLEIREFHGLTLIQDENKSSTDRYSFNNIVTKSNNLTYACMIDLIIANTALKYTQSNSVVAAKDGQLLGVGAGQQSRIDCVKLVKRKVNYWYIKQHPKCLYILTKFKKGTKKSAKINAIIRYIEFLSDEPDQGGTGTTSSIYFEWIKMFNETTIPLLYDKEIKNHLKTLDNVSLASDAFFPFTDNIEVAHEFGVKYIVQPGGSISDTQVIQVCDKYGMIMAMTGRDMRMFLH